MSTPNTIETYKVETLEDLTNHLPLIRDTLDFGNTSGVKTHPADVYVRDQNGNHLRFMVVENLLTDGSKTYDVVVSPIKEGQ